MLEIDAAVIERILSDEEIKILLGSSNDDERIYSWNPPQNIVYSNNKTSALFYRNSINKRGMWSYPSQFHNILYFFRVVSLNETKAQRIIEKLIDLFDANNNNSLETDHFSVKKIDFSNKTDSPNEGTTSFPLYVKNISFNFTNIFRR